MDLYRAPCIPTSERYTALCTTRSFSLFYTDQQQQNLGRLYSFTLFFDGSWEDVRPSLSRRSNPTTPLYDMIEKKKRRRNEPCFPLWVILPSSIDHASTEPKERERIFHDQRPTEFSVFSSSYSLGCCYNSPMSTSFVFWSVSFSLLALIQLYTIGSREYSSSSFPLRLDPSLFFAGWKEKRLSARRNGCTQAATIV